MPSGMLYVFNYIEELKERPTWEASPSAELRSYMLEFIDGIADTGPAKFSLKRISNAVDRWFNALLPAPKTNVKKAPSTRKTKVNA
jgi:hypothetical protein